MANVALIIAGGTGARMNQDVPKQFLTVYDKPIIVYTLECFERHGEIDGIVISCLDGWQKVLEAYIKQFGIKKVRGIVTGGKNGQESIKNGVNAIAKIYAPEDLIMVHDAIRPMLPGQVITDSITKCRKYGNSIAVIPCMEAMLRSDDEIESEESILRNSLFRAQTPQTISLSDMLSLHDEANKNGITDSVATCTLLLELGHKVFFSNGSELNIKITTIEDIKIFKALLVARDSAWLKEKEA